MAKVFEAAISYHRKMSSSRSDGTDEVEGAVVKLRSLSQVVAVSTPNQLKILFQLIFIPYINLLVFILHVPDVSDSLQKSSSRADDMNVYVYQIIKNAL